MREWDPIGVRDIPEAADEYDTYVAYVQVMMREGRTSPEIASYLVTAETEYIGLTPRPDTSERARRVADAAIGLRDQLTKLH